MPRKLRIISKDPIKEREKISIISEYLFHKNHCLKILFSNYLIFDRTLQFVKVISKKCITSVRVINSQYDVVNVGLLLTT